MAKSTFTIMADGGIVKASPISRNVVMTINSHTGSLTSLQSLTLRIGNDATKEVDLDSCGITTARVVVIQPSVEDNFGDESSEGVTISFNGQSDGATTFRGRCFLMMSECEVTSISILNESGNEISVEVFVAGDK